MQVCHQQTYRKVIQLNEQGYLKSNIVKGDKFADKAIYEISDKGRCYFEQLMNSYTMEKGKALELVKRLRNCIVSPANTTDEYAAEYPNIPLVGKSIASQKIEVLARKHNKR